MTDDKPLILLTGATGYVGGLLLPLLEKQPVVVRCLARNPDKIRRSRETSQVVEATFSTSLRSTKQCRGSTLRITSSI